MKKVFIIVISLLISSSNISTAAEMRPCASKQINKVLNGSVCKKVGIFYRWVKVDTPVVTTQPTPVSKTTIAQPVPTVTTKPSVSDKEKVFDIIKSNKNTSIDNIKYSFFIGDNFPKDILYKYQSISTKTLAYWDKFLSPNSKINIYFITEKDKDFYSKEISKYSNSKWIIDQAFSNLEIYNSNMNYSPGGATTQIYDNNNSPVAIVTIWAKSTHKAVDAHNDLPAHEITHAYQFLETVGINKQNFIQDPANPNSWVEKEILIPCNLIEGTAVLFGVGITTDTYEQYSAELIKINERTKNSYNVTSVKTVDDILKQMQVSNSWLSDRCSIGYSLGAYIYEWLILKNGVQSYTNLFDSIRLNGRMEPALQQTVSMSLNTLYLEAKNYVFLEYSKK